MGSVSGPAVCFGGDLPAEVGVFVRQGRRRFIEDVKIGQTGRAILVDLNTGNIIAHIDKEKLSKTVDSSVYDNLKSNEKGLSYVQVDGEKQLYAYNRLKEINAAVVSHVKETEAFSIIQSLQKKNTIVYLLCGTFHSFAYSITGSDTVIP